MALKTNDRDPRDAINISQGAMQTAKPEPESEPKPKPPSEAPSQSQTLATSLAPELATLLNQLADKVGRCMALLGEWDEDNTGAVLKQEFRRALPALGIRASREEAEGLFDALDDTSQHAELLQHAELERLLRGHVAMRAAAANKAKGGGRGPVTRAGSKTKLTKPKHVPGPVSNAYHLGERSLATFSSLSTTKGHETLAAGATDPLGRPAWDATAPREGPKRIANEHAEARRNKAAAAAAALIKSPGTLVVAAAKREMAALSPDGAAGGVV